MKLALARQLITLIGFVLLILCILHFGILPYYDSKNNAVFVTEPYKVSKNTRILHETAFVADLHADPLLWKRNLLKRNSYGHIDLPRLKQGGIDLQVFSVVTKVPVSNNLQSNPDDSDVLPLLFLASWRSPATWFSPKERALTQARELVQLATDPSFSLVLKRQDLLAKGTRGLLSLEGMHALEGKEEALIELYSAGFRMMGLAHFFDNKVAGSAHGERKYGLTNLGRSLIPRMETLGITIDLAHASPTAFRETLALVTKPVVVSHGGVKGTCLGLRSLADSQIRSIADNGGVIGIGYWKSAVCNASVDGIVSAILYTIKIAGIDHVGLGSDFDGHVTTPFDASGLPLLSEALLQAGLTAEELFKVLGGNVLRVLTTNLPEK